VSLFYAEEAMPRGIMPTDPEFDFYLSLLEDLEFEEKELEKSRARLKHCQEEMKRCREAIKRTKKAIPDFLKENGFTIPRP
jgi:hypothetical protein